MCSHFQESLLFLIQIFIFPTKTLPAQLLFSKITLYRRFQIGPQSLVRSVLQSYKLIRFRFGPQKTIKVCLKILYMLVLPVTKIMNSFLWPDNYSNLFALKSLLRNISMVNQCWFQPLHYHLAPLFTPLDKIHKNNFCNILLSSLIKYQIF